MVTRIPSPPNVVPAPLRQAANNPPYPTNDSAMPTIDSSENRPSFEHVESKGPSAPNGEGSRSRASSVSSHGTWNSDGSDEQEQEDGELPEALRPGPRKSAEQQRSREDIPPSLRPNVPKAVNGNTPNGTTVWPHYQQQQTTPLKSHNPYLNMQASPSAPQSQSPAQEPVELPTVKTPEQELAGLSLNHQPSSPARAPSQPPPPVPLGLPSIQNDVTGQSVASQASQSSNPWQDALDHNKVATPADQPPLPSLLDSAPDPPPKGEEPALSAAAPSLPPLDLSGTSSFSAPKPEVETPRTQAKRQRNEFYHIKHVNWYDASAKGKGSLRRSPILTQNANGPCPLLALVNALTLSTPENEDTALVHTLKDREQITLGLLLDAVFEELVRRNERSGHDLPDIGDLYSFLITLHTGMNVNPAFTSSTAAQPGGFEQTREMKLYSSFDVPLVHGWTAPAESPVYKAFERSAKTFDEALNMQFMEEEFEHKLQAGGLNAEEQQVFEDLTAVKDFLTTFPTQISDHGLHTMSSWMKPGQLAILFRNDHFCTLYKEPKKGVLMTLVTDAGYATHDEVVWESLVDVNGARAEFFSGDFRPVGAAPSASRQNSGAAGAAGGWQAAPPQAGHVPSAEGKSAALQTDLPQPASKSEQEDLDLALALQLQEEEEEAHRREAASRQNAHNDSLSRQYIDRQSSENEQRPPIPPRRSHRPAAQPGTYSGPVQAAQRTDDGTAPPPTYEQAASDMPYREAGSTPRPPRQGNPLNALSALDAQRQQSAFTAQSGQQGPVMAPGYGRRRQSRFGSWNGPAQPGYNQPGSVASAGREEKCVMM
ncbi:MINDY deubiquitinase-like protein [Elsinoe fawcettii]|nr:MINDY deubiquitinase-like protein [Elsinoe fawcettii]